MVPWIFHLSFASDLVFSTIFSLFLPALRNKSSPWSAKVAFLHSHFWNSLFLLHGYREILAWFLLLGTPKHCANAMLINWWSETHLNFCKSLLFLQAAVVTASGVWAIKQNLVSSLNIRNTSLSVKQSIQNNWLGWAHGKGSLWGEKCAVYSMLFYAMILFWLIFRRLQIFARIKWDFQDIFHSGKEK